MGNSVMQPEHKTRNSPMFTADTENARSYTTNYQSLYDVLFN
jgi:hypothetical protein